MWLLVENEKIVHECKVYEEAMDYQFKVRAKENRDVQIKKALYQVRFTEKMSRVIETKEEAEGLKNKIESTFQIKSEVKKAWKY